MEHRIGIIMNGVTGRMGTNQHLIRSILSIRSDGGVVLPNGDTIHPEPVLLGRNEKKLRQLAEKQGVERFTTNLSDALGDKHNQIYFDAQITNKRYDGVLTAIKAGKHIYCEKPTGSTLQEAINLYQEAERAGVKHGVVQDKLWLPGMLKLKRLIDDGFFGRILSVRGEFGYWVFEGFREKAQRPSWNYRKEDGGGIIVDMLCHWRYVLDNLFGEVQSVSCLGATHIPSRVDEHGSEYVATADDAAYATFKLSGDVVAHFNSSWTVRVRRDDLLTVQVDGTDGSAVAGLRECYTQSFDQTPKPVWNPDVPQPIDFYEDWTKVDDHDKLENAFKAQWVLFLKHVVADEPFRWNLLEGAKGVQLAELGMESWRLQKWITVDALDEKSTS